MTTQTELRALLEDAAYAMGWNSMWWTSPSCGEKEFLIWPDDELDRDATGWSPHLDSADGAEMESALEITVEYSNGVVEAWKRGFSAIREELISQHDNKQAARLMASLRVAAAIGKAKREQEAA